MPLKTGLGSFKFNVDELTKGKVASPSRKKAINTIAKKYGLTKEQAREYQAIKIAKANLKK